MKQRILSTLLFSTLAMSSIAEEVFCLSSTKSIIVNTKFIDSFENDENRTDIIPYDIKQTRVSTITSYNSKYTINLSKYHGWEGEAGDFNVIEIISNNKTLLSLKNDEGWDYFYLAKDYQKDMDNFFKEIKLSNDITVLVFTGVTIMSQPPFVTIIALEKGKATVIYNKQSYINEIRTENGETIFDLQLNTVEYHDNHIPYDDPELATLTFKNGMIYYDGK